MKILFTNVLDSGLNHGHAVVLSTVLFSVSTVNYTMYTSFGRLIICHVIKNMNVNIISVMSPLCVSRISMTRCHKHLMSLCRLTIAVNFLKTCLVGCRLLVCTRARTKTTSD